MSQKKKNLDTYLGEIFKQHIAIKDEDYKKSQEVFKCVFDQVKQKMGERCNYFGKYSSQVMYAGSVYDGIKVSKLDEFDMDIVIRLPINYDDGITIENADPGFLKLKIGEAFDLLDKQQEWEKCHVVTRDWRDGDKYLLQNKFRQWMHSVVGKAINELNQVTVNGNTYMVFYKESGPAYTLNIQNGKGGEEFKLDVDLVPVIRFQLPRWPEGYRTVEGCTSKDWLVVPKPNKALQDGKMKNQCWRLSFQEFERDMMKGCQQLKTTIRLVKKLRDSLQINIASYYIKTLFLWKIDKEKDKKYWQKPLSVMFRIMVEEFYIAVRDKNIPYFWQKKNNLIATLKPTLQKLYSDKLKDVLDSIDANDVDKVVSKLLSRDELQAFKNSEFYKNQEILFAFNLAFNVATPSTPVKVSRQVSTVSNSSVSESRKTPEQDNLTELLKSAVDKLNGLCAGMGDIKTVNGKDKVDGTHNNIDAMRSIIEKIDKLSEQVSRQNEKIAKLENGFGSEMEKLNSKLDILLDKFEEQNEKMKMLEKKQRSAIDITNDHVAGEMMLSVLE